MRSPWGQGRRDRSLFGGRLRLWAVRQPAGLDELAELRQDLGVLLAEVALPPSARCNPGPVAALIDAEECRTGRGRAPWPRTPTAW